jgi:hypothetical protein
VSGVLAALAAWLLPRPRGRHRRLPVPDDDTVVFPVCEDEADVPPAWLTRLDLPPGRVRPYVDGGDPPEMIP